MMSKAKNSIKVKKIWTVMIEQTMANLYIGLLSVTRKFVMCKKITIQSTI